MLKTTFASWNISVHSLSSNILDSNLFYYRSLIHGFHNRLHKRLHRTFQMLRLGYILPIIIFYLVYSL